MWVMVGGLMLVHHQTRMKWAVVVVGLTIEATIHVGGVVASVGASWRPHHHHQGGGAQHPRRRRRAGHAHAPRNSTRPSLSVYFPLPCS